MLSLAAFTLLFSALPQEEPPSFLPAQVGEHAATVRSFCHSETPVLTDLFPDTPVRVVAQRQPWSRIQVPGGFEVWVYGDFVDRDGNVGTLNATHVRARPLPNTTTKSYPVGQFLKGDRVLILDEKEKWLRVRAPESLGAWVLSESIVLLDETPDNWDELWAEALPKEMQIKEADVPEAEVLEELVKEQEISTAPSTETTEAVGLIKLDVPETPVAQETPATEAEPVTEQPVAEVEAPASDFSDRMQVAEDGLTNLSALGWNPTLAEQVESIFGAILWTSSELSDLEQAQAGLERLEHLRMLATGGTAEQAQFSAMEASATRSPAKSVNSYSLVGKLEYSPDVYSAVPYTIATGDTKDSVLSRDGKLLYEPILTRSDKKTNHLPSNPTGFQM